MHSIVLHEKRYLELYTAERQMRELLTLLTQTDEKGKSFDNIGDVVEHIKQLNLKIEELETELDEANDAHEEYKACAAVEHDTYCSRCGKTFRYCGEHEPTYCSRACELGEQPPQGSLLTEDQFHATLRTQAAGA